MKVVLRQKLKQPKAVYQEYRELPLLDNTKIFKRTSYKYSDYSVYIWCDKTVNSSINFGFGLEIPYEIIYIGMGQSFGRKEYWRAFTHKDDLLEKVLMNNPERYICYIPVIATSECNARAFEAFLINEIEEKFNYTLTKCGCFEYNYNIKQLVNKRREHSQRRNANKFLNFNNQWR